MYSKAQLTDGVYQATSASENPIFYHLEKRSKQSSRIAVEANPTGSAEKGNVPLFDVAGTASTSLSNQTEAKTKAKNANDDDDDDIGTPCATLPVRFHGTAFDGQMYYQNETAIRLSSDAMTQQAVVDIPVYFHFICEESESQCPPQEIADRMPEQMQVLNDAFRAHGFSFSLTGTKNYFNNTLHEASITQERDTILGFMRSHYIGTIRTLNVYVKDLQSSSINGFTDRVEWSVDHRCSEVDTIMMDFRRFPGMWNRSGKRQALGKTLPHEVGHWLGLEHTFDGGCEGTDFQVTSPFVDDTIPADTSGNEIFSSKDKENFRNCLVRECSGTKMFKATNLMDYTADRCRQNFSANQGKVMRFNFFSCRTQI